jgi:FMN phosphatase YigB (HAD superfamily)
MQTVILFDVDKTLLDNDRILSDLRTHLEQEFGIDRCKQYFAILEELRSQLGYVDYLGALQRYRLENPRDPKLLAISAWFIEYPFPDRLYPDALKAIAHCRTKGLTAILSDGDVVFQPWKVRRSGIWDAVENRVLIYIHKEQMLDDVERRYPADHYVMVDDKLRLLTAIKAIWKERVTTIFPKQGHYALDANAIAKYPPPDITIDRIGDLLDIALPPSI